MSLNSELSNIVATLNSIVDHKHKGFRKHIRIEDQRLIHNLTKHIDVVSEKVQESTEYDVTIEYAVLSANYELQILKAKMTNHRIISISDILDIVSDAQEVLNGTYISEV